jgi:glycosyltransferase involved in cell wall biosynthesis
VKDEFIEIQPGDVFLGLDLQHHVVATQNDYLTMLRNSGVRVYFVVYDLLPIMLPDCFLPGSAEGHSIWLKIISQFDGVVCISKVVAEELSKWLEINGAHGLRPLKISWFHVGADVENSVPTRGLPDNANHVLKELVGRPTFVTVGTIEPRKGQDQILSAFELLWKENVDVNLVIVGKQGWMVGQLVNQIREHEELGKRLFWLDGISDEYLEKVYKASICLIAASKGEGFGLPLIEAAQHKLPIIARDIPVFREVAGDHAFYFSGLEPKNLAKAINNWLKLNANNKAPQSTNIPWLTWKQSTQQLLQAILPEVRPF